MTDHDARTALVIQPVTGVRRLIDPGGIWRHRYLIQMLVRREYLTRYRQTVLGPIWLVIQPLVSTVVFALVFARGVGLSTEQVPPLLFYFSGMILWQCFSQSAHAISVVFEANRGLLKRLYFPRLVLPLSLLISNLLGTLIHCALMALMLLAYDRHLAWSSPWRVVGLGACLLLTCSAALGTGLLISAATSRYRDLLHATGFVLQTWLFLTPVIYPTSAIPQRWRWLIALNPLAAPVDGIRELWFGIGGLSSGLLALSLASNLVLLLLGIGLFARLEPGMMDGL